MLKIKKLTKYFGGVAAVNNCSFKIERGKITALIGPNGSGKTTVLDLISGIIKPDSGEIIFLQKNIVGSSVEKISKLGVSRVFQQSRLFKNLTVKENLLLAINNDDQNFWKNMLGFSKSIDEKEDIVIKALKEINMSKYKDVLASELSFGQKRLIDIMRAILNPHELLIIDEPIAGINPKLRLKIYDKLISLKEKGVTILIVEHDMPFTFKVSDVIIVMETGSIIAKGTPNEIKKNKDVLKAYLG